ncbi:MAG: ParB/RepB/Spo0J family partition protein [Candidatus Hadarchaeum sp.]
MKIIRVPISKCEPWQKNPRGITKEDFERLKKQIQELGVYKPLVACKENGKYIILGGNMRIRALKELGHKEVEISLVEAPSKVEKIKYSLSDNDRAGYYEEELLAELVYPHINEINFDDYKVDIGSSININDLVDKFGPELKVNETEIDENIKTQYVCPRCGYKW